MQAKSPCLSFRFHISRRPVVNNSGPTRGTDQTRIPRCLLKFRVAPRPAEIKGGGPDTSPSIIQVRIGNRSIRNSALSAARRDSAARRSTGFENGVRRDKEESAFHFWFSRLGPARLRSSRKVRLHFHRDTRIAQCDTFRALPSAAFRVLYRREWFARLLTVTRRQPFL